MRYDIARALVSDRHKRHGGEIRTRKRKGVVKDDELKEEDESKMKKKNYARMYAGKGGRKAFA